MHIHCKRRNGYLEVYGRYLFSIFHMPSHVLIDDEAFRNEIRLSIAFDGPSAEQLCKQAKKARSAKSHWP